MNLRSDGELLWFLRDRTLTKRFFRPSAKEILDPAPFILPGRHERYATFLALLTREEGTHCRCLLIRTYPSRQTACSHIGFKPRRDAGFA